MRALTFPQGSFLFVCVCFLLFSFIFGATGDGTQYAGSLSSSSGAKGYNCGFMWIPPNAQTHFAAINKPEYNTSANCGRCATVTCNDSRCGTYNKQVKVMIVDSCPECKAGDLDFSLSAWNDITNNHSPDRFKISWDWSVCDGKFVDGTLKMGVDSGANNYYASIQILNHNVGIQSARIGLTMDSLEELTRRDNNFFFKTLAKPLLTMPYYVEFTDINSKKYSAKFTSFTPGSIYDFGTSSDATTNAGGSSSGTSGSTSGSSSSSSSGTSTSGSSSSSTSTNSSSSTSTSGSTSGTSTSGSSTSATTTWQTGVATQALQAFTAENGAIGQNCGYMWLPTGARSYFSGIDMTTYNSSSSCGRCIIVKCNDARCGDYKKEVKVMLTDSCGSCGSNGINLSLPAWNDVTNKYSPDKFQVQWAWAVCDGSFVEGNIRMGIEKAANAYYTSISISNTNYGVKSVSIGLSLDKMEKLQRRTDNYWIKTLNAQINNPPFYVSFTDLNDKTYQNKFNDYTPGKVYEWDTASVAAAPSSTSPTSSAISSSSSSKSGYFQKAAISIFSLALLALFN